MINYYWKLSIDPRISELQLNLLFKRVRISSSYNNKQKKLYKEFEDTIRRYGSKENYDKSLKNAEIKKRQMEVEKQEEISIKNAKIKKFKENFNWKRAALVVGITGVLAGSIVTASSYKIVEIPLYDNESLETVSQELGINSSRFFGVKAGEDRSAKIIVSNRYVDDIEALMAERDKYYTFNYIVQQGDSRSGIESRFNGSVSGGTGSSSDILWAGEEVLVSVRGLEGKKLAEKMQKIYDETKKKKEQDYIDSITPDSFEEYVVQPGELVVDIANKFGVEAKDLVRFNDNIPDVDTIYAGSTIRIPIFEKQNVK